MALNDKTCQNLRFESTHEYTWLPAGLSFIYFQQMCYMCVCVQFCSFSLLLSSKRGIS